MHREVRAVRIPTRKSCCPLHIRRHPNQGTSLGQACRGGLGAPALGWAHCRRRCAEGGLWDTKWPPMAEAGRLAVAACPDGSFLWRLSRGCWDPIMGADGVVFWGPARPHSTRRDSRSGCWFTSLGPAESKVGGMGLMRSARMVPFPWGWRHELDMLQDTGSFPSDCTRSLEVTFDRRLGGLSHKRWEVGPCKLVHSTPPLRGASDKGPITPI